MIYIPNRVLNAAFLCRADSKDSRQWLKNILITTTLDGYWQVCASDSHIAVRVSNNKDHSLFNSSGLNRDSFELSGVKLPKKGKAIVRYDELSRVGFIKIEGVEVKAADLRFPDISRAFSSYSEYKDGVGVAELSFTVSVYSKLLKVMAGLGIETYNLELGTTGLHRIVEIIEVEGILHHVELLIMGMVD